MISHRAADASESHGASLGLVNRFGSMQGSFIVPQEFQLVQAVAFH